ncbi:putative nuclease HARBI1 [Capsella rubella]|uniref:putative nuclease HARBI1 n=1 Tax=Capsella rubella TaxID=81985 RepID=UPI000CD4D22B|nr:putative nuclease HARBI1 [Capsella rubella]
MVHNSEAPSYRNRKGVISQNVLAVCNFDMEFIYVLSGWEGSAHDSKVLYDALSKFYLADCGFANRRKFLAPFRATKYHLQDFTGQGCDPETPHELFNHRHASLRNVIERIFGIFKSRFLIFKTAPPFPYKTQTEIVLACVALHNFLRKHCRSDEFLTQEVGDEANMENNTPLEDFQNNEEVFETQDQERESANIWREAMAQQMWSDATS